MGFATSFFRPSAMAAFLLVSVSPVSIAIAQNAPAGTDIRFSIEQRLDWASNRDLDVTDTNSEFYATTGFNLDVDHEVGAHRFTFGADFDLIAGRDDSDRNGFSNPDLVFDYAQQSAAGLFEVNAFVNEADVDTLDFVDSGTGSISSVDGTGTRRRSGASTSYTFGTNAPFGGTLSLGVVDTDYSDTTDDSLTDTTRTSLGLDFRFDLSPVTSASLGLQFEELEEEGEDDEDINTFSLGLTRALINGSASIRAQATDLDSGTRTKLTVGRFVDLPRGDLQVNLGVSDPVNGSQTLVGGLEWNKDLPSGGLRFTLDQDVTGDEQEDETRITTASLRLQHQLNARWGSNVFLNYRDSHDQQGGQDTESSSIGVNFDYALNQDWDLRFGAQHRQRTTTGEGTADDNSLYFAVRRNFQLKR